MSIGIKICGLTEATGIQTALECHVDWLGFVFFARSPRHLTPEQAAVLMRTIPIDGPKRVGLFVKPSNEQIIATLAQVPLDVLQIYDTPERAADIRATFNIPVWLACGIAHADDLPTQTALDGLVIESRPHAQATRPGGNGQRFDWNLTKNWAAPAPWLLAGGLNPENVGEAIIQSGTLAVDVSSGVETVPGIKNPDLIRKFIESARASCLPSRN